MSIIDDIKREMKALQDKLADIQAGCSHPIREIKWHMITDEYGMEEGGYTSYHCQLCDKKWTESDK